MVYECKWLTFSASCLAYHIHSLHEFKSAFVFGTVSKSRRPKTRLARLPNSPHSLCPNESFTKSWKLAQVKRFNQTISWLFDLGLFIALIHLRITFKRPLHFSDLLLYFTFTLSQLMQRLNFKLLSHLTLFSL